MMFYKKRIPISGTQASPQEFTTNVAPLDVDDDGYRFPAFRKLPLIVLSARQDRKLNLVDGTEQLLADGNVKFRLSLSDVGQAGALDNFFDVQFLTMDGRT